MGFTTKPSKRPKCGSICFATAASDVCSSFAAAGPEQGLGLPLGGWQDEPLDGVAGPEPHGGAIRLPWTSISRSFGAGKIDPHLFGRATPSHQRLLERSTCKEGHTGSLVWCCCVCFETAFDSTSRWLQCYAHSSGQIIENGLSWTCVSRCFTGSSSLFIQFELKMGWQRSSWIWRQKKPFWRSIYIMSSEFIIQFFMHGAHHQHFWLPCLPPMSPMQWSPQQLLWRLHHVILLRRQLQQQPAHRQCRCLQQLLGGMGKLNILICLSLMMLWLSCMTTLHVMICEVQMIYNLQMCSRVSTNKILDRQWHQCHFRLHLFWCELLLKLPQHSLSPCSRASKTFCQPSCAHEGHRRMSSLFQSVRKQMQMEDTETQQKPKANKLLGWRRVVLALLTLMATTRSEMVMEYLISKRGTMAIEDMEEKKKDLTGRKGPKPKRSGIGRWAVVLTRRSIYVTELAKVTFGTHAFNVEDLGNDWKQPLQVQHRWFRPRSPTTQRTCHRQEADQICQPRRWRWSTRPSPCQQANSCLWPITWKPVAEPQTGWLAWTQCKDQRLRWWLMEVWRVVPERCSSWPATQRTRSTRTFQWSSPRRRSHGWMPRPGRSWWWVRWAPNTTLWQPWKESRSWIHDGWEGEGLAGQHQTDP